MTNPTKGYVSTKLGQIHYRVLGDGPPVVLLPHSGRSSRMFARLMRELAARYRVFAVDLPGSGESAPLIAGATFEAIAGSLIEAFRALDLRDICLYGIHTGNKLGAIIAADQAAPIKKFVFAGQTHSLIADQKLRNATIGAIVRDVVGRGLPDGAASAVDWAVRIGELYAHCMARATLDEITAKSDFTAQLEWLIDEAQGTIARRSLYEANFAYDLERDLRRITIPTLILEIATPDEDRQFGRQGAIVQRIVRGSRLQTLEEPAGVGLTMDHRAQEIAGIIGAFFDE
jgi:pimeloyl-ACP methyl ester carboxylesterase